MYSHSAVYQGSVAAPPCFGMYTKQLTPSLSRRKKGEEGIFFCLVYLNTLLVMMITISRIFIFITILGLVYCITKDTVTLT